MDEEQIGRINALARKAKAEGLSEGEKEEQTKLRREYIEAIRMNLRGSLDRIQIQNPDGTVTDLGKKHAEKGN